MTHNLQRGRSVLSLLAVATLLALAAPADAARPPNIVLVIVDDLGWSDLGCYGADLHETPHIDGFAREALRFTDAYAAAPVCTPTRASILTGKFPARLGMTIWREQAASGPQQRGRIRTAEAATDLPHAERTLAEVLHDGGYLTAHVGKWHLGDAAHYPETHGFDFNIGASLWGAPSTFFAPYRGLFGRSQEYRYIPGIHWAPEGEYLTDRLTDEALDVIGKAGSRPFFLHLAYHTVHTPIEAKPDIVDRFRQKLRPGMQHQNPTFAAMVHSLDENFGRLLDTLRKQELYEDTVIVLVSDNGGFVGDYDGQTVTSNVPLRSGKGSLYEGGIRIPLIVRAPGVTPAGAVSSTPVCTTDLYETLCALVQHAGHSLENVAATDGRNLLGVLQSPANAIDREALYFHYPHFYATTTPVSAVRAGSWKLLHYYDDGHDELYNLADDLGETRDLSTSQPERAAQLRRQLDDWLASVDARLPVISETPDSP